MKKRIGVLHSIARCQDCGWEAEGFKNAQAIAAKHAKSKGHRVIGEVGIGYEYDGRGEKSL